MHPHESNSPTEISHDEQHKEEIISPKLPTKIIQSKQDLEQFQQSETYNNILSFVLRINDSVKGKTNTAPCHVSEAVLSILEVLKQMDTWIDEIPPLPQRSRFGNKAFCTYFEKVESNLSDLMKKVLSFSSDDESSNDRVQQLGPYLLNCFGDKQRLDYGSGHELNFVMWLYCLEKLKIINSQDYTALVVKVFDSYLTVMRHLQVQYWLEPAGSHGVWGLDDYQFLPFLWGAAQLIDHKYIRPKSIVNQETVEGFAKDYMYLRCIQFINKVKNGSFFEHSPLLYDISGAKSWLKVNEGMIKMFKAEVIGKLPIMKHFFFGELIPLELRRDSQHSENHENGHGHDDECCEDEEMEGMDDNQKQLFRLKSCCVQRIPSSIAAKGMEDKMNLKL